MFYLVALEFDDPFTVLTDDVIVVRMLRVIGIVELIIFPKIHFANQPTFGEQRQSAIDRGPRNRFIARARPGQELFGGKMLAGAECGIDDGASLSCQAQALSRYEIQESLLGARFDRVWHRRSIRLAERRSQRGPQYVSMS